MLTDVLCATGKAVGEEQPQNSNVSTEQKHANVCVKKPGVSWGQGESCNLPGALGQNPFMIPLRPHGVW